MPDASRFLDADELRANTFVRHVELHDELGSTNDRALELARDESIDLPALVVARRQTAGRGRGCNSWWSADGALTFSLLIDAASTGIQPANWPPLSLATAVAVCDALTVAVGWAPPTNYSAANDMLGSAHPTSLGIKWPNDVYAAGRKIAGILIESPGGPATAKDRLVIGVGVNVNNSWQDAPPGFGEIGTSLIDITGRQQDVRTVLVELLNRLKSRLEQLRKQDLELMRAWQSLNHLAARAVTLEANGRHVEGECVEIGYDGALVLKTASGRQRFFSGTVRVVNRALWPPRDAFSSYRS